VGPRLYPFALFAAWVVAWIVNLTLRSRMGWDVRVDTIYWIALKAIVWVVPVVLVIRLRHRDSVAGFLDLRNLSKGLRWGFGVGAALVVITFLGRTLPSGSTITMPELSLPLVNAVIVSPLVEEITLRGFLLKELELSGDSFWRANTLTALVFLAMHLPGWLFQGRIPTAAGFAQRALPIAALGLLFGWTKRRADSLYAAIVVHAINNVYSALFP